MEKRDSSGDFANHLWKKSLNDWQGMSRFSSDIIINGFSTPFKLSEFIKEGFNYKYLNIQSLLTWYLQSFLPIIFYLQFGYLYSFQPSNFPKEFIEKLVERSKRRNKAEAENVYNTLKDGFVTYFTAKTMSFMRFNKSTQEISKVVHNLRLSCMMLFRLLMRKIFDALPWRELERKLCASAEYIERRC